MVAWGEIGVLVQFSAPMGLVFGRASAEGGLISQDLLVLRLEMALPLIFGQINGVVRAF